MIEMSPGEVADRYTILRMKVVKAPGLMTEFAKYSNEVIILNEKHNIWPMLLVLMEMNAKIWMLEADIRNGKEMPLEEVGRRALAIRDFNKHRVQAKAYIDSLIGFTPDVKVDHASQ